MKSLADVVASHEIVVCAGSGGVGKTTAAAAIAVHAARSGRQPIVLTIDPARRLADALGLSEIGNREVSVRLGPGQSLRAMMLDQKSAWDALVERHAPSEQVRQSILRNRFYQHLSQSFSGSQEYMAVEQLAELHASGRYDLIVLDTPPTRHALDFLDAPRRIADFLDRDIVRWFVKPYFSAGWATLRIINRTAGALVRRLEDATGISTLMEISDFFTSMSGLFDGFEQRVRRIEALLRSPKTAFVLVAGPDEQVLKEAEYFRRKASELSVPIRAVVFNRLHRESAQDIRALNEPTLCSKLARIPPIRKSAARFVQNFLAYEALARGESRRVNTFSKHLPRATTVASVPTFDEDLHDIRGLERMIPYLMGTHV